MTSKAAIKQAEQLQARATKLEDAAKTMRSDYRRQAVEEARLMRTEAQKLMGLTPIIESDQRGRERIILAKLPD